MQILVEVKDSKADFLMELLRSLKFVRAKRLTASKAEFLDELGSSVESVKRAKAGKLSLRDAREVADEL